ncbi:AraC family transcriptional regulator [Clostridiaceae bacterium M8S5]|nr:AraC family transcriptional regulator [Clostridiaceae bacterium M8S5]
MEWLKRLSKAIDYVEDNLENEISYDEAAKIACCSTYYFQRMFSYVTGVTLSEYIRRRRMTSAAFDLQSSDMKVMDIGLKYGYESPTSFNRAFQSVHGISPSVARLQGTLLNAYLPISFSVTITGDENMKYMIETKKAMRVVGVRVQLQNDMEQNQKIVPMLWDEVLNNNRFEEICELRNNDANAVFGITVYENQNNIYYYIAVQSDKPVPQGMVELEIASATWVVFENDGLFKESVQNIFKRFLTQWLPFSDYEYAGLPDIEVYPIKKKSKRGQVQVWIAIKKEVNNI